MPAAPASPEPNCVEPLVEACRLHVHASSKKRSTTWRGGHMKSSFISSMSLAVLCGVGLAAQDVRSTKADRATADTVTVIGCVDRADQLSAASPDTTVDSLSFVLTHASRDGEAASSRPTTDTRSAAAQAGSIYRLDGAVATLNPHVGH